MDSFSNYRRMWEHLFWADAALLDAVTSAAGSPPEAAREFAHIIGAEEVWLARLEDRPARLPVWPSITGADLGPMVREVHGHWEDYLAGLQEADVEASVAYSNSAGVRFENSVGDILRHVALHGQYHRGKVNLLLRQAGGTPVPVDYIAYVRGAPAATEADARRKPD